MGWPRATLSFAIITATNLRLRGSRIRGRSALNMADGIGLPYIVEEIVLFLLLIFHM